jgi:hypothetical protein
MDETIFRNELAKRLGVHKNTIVSAVKALGLKKRTKVTGGRRKTCYSIDEVLLIKHQIDKHLGTGGLIIEKKREPNIFNSYQRLQEY